MQVVDLDTTEKLNVPLAPIFVLLVFRAYLKKTVDVALVDHSKGGL